jgi:hypothetical protein
MSRTIALSTSKMASLRRSSLAHQADGTSHSRTFRARSRLRETRLFLLSLAAAVTALPATAQVSSNEFLAAYCLGVFEQRLKDGLASGLAEDAARQQAQTVRRLYQYLRISTGTQTATAPLAALSTVRESGTRDQSECMSGIAANFTAMPSQCADKCQPPIQDYELCLSCPPADAEPEACKRVLQCKAAPAPQPRGPASADQAAPQEAPQPPKPVAVAPVVTQPPKTATVAPVATQPAKPVLVSPIVTQPATPAPVAAQPQPQPPRPPVPSVRPPPPPAQQAAVAPARPEARPPAAPTPPPAQQEAVRGEPARPAAQCAVSRPKPGFQVYLVTCPNSRATIGRTVDMPTGWTVSEGVNETEAVDYFMKSRYAR